MDKFSQVTQYIDKVAQAVSAKFNIAASEIYKTLILQTKVDLFKDIFWIILFIAATIILIIMFKKLIKGYTNENSIFYDDDDDVFYGYTFIIIGMIILITLTIIKVLAIIQIAVNPNYYIFKYYLLPLVK